MCVAVCLAAELIKYQTTVKTTVPHTHTHHGLKLKQVGLNLRLRKKLNPVT